MVLLAMPVMFIEEFTSFLEYVYWFISSGMWQPLKDFASFLILLFTELYWAVKLAAVTFAWDTAKAMMEQMSFNQILDSLFNGFDSQIKDMLLYFRIPDFVYTLVTAYLTRYVFSFVSKLTFGIL